MIKPFWITIIILFIFILILGGYIFHNNIPARSRELRALRQEVGLQQQKIDDLSFQLGASKLANNQLRLDIADRDLEITRLEAHELAYSDMVDIFKYSLTYINYLQLRMTEYGVSFPGFIVRDIMREIIIEGIE